MNLRFCAVIVTLLSWLAPTARASSTRCWGRMIEPDCGANTIRWAPGSQPTFAGGCEGCGRVGDGGACRLIGFAGGGFSMVAEGGQGLGTNFVVTGARCGEDHLVRYEGPLVPGARHEIIFPGNINHSQPVSFRLEFWVDPLMPDAGQPGASALDAGQAETGLMDTPDAGATTSPTRRAEPGGCSHGGGAGGASSLVLLALVAAAAIRRRARISLGVRSAMPALIVALSGCGTEGGGSCADGPACGGEIVPGRYRATCMSITGKMTWKDCREGISIVSSDLTLTGTYTFNADKTFQADLILSGSITQRIPASCPTLDGKRLPCAQLGSAMSGPGRSVSCTGTDACDCTTIASSPEMGSGTYSTSGTSLYRFLGAAPSLSEYCATPTSLTLARDNDVGDVTGPMDSTFRSVLVFAKE